MTLAGADLDERGEPKAELFARYESDRVEALAYALQENPSLTAVDLSANAICGFIGCARNAQGAAATISVGMRRHAAVHALLAVGEGSDLAGVHPHVGRHVERSAMAVVAVEAIDVRTILHRFGKVDVLPFAFLFVYASPVPAQVPLSDHLGVVSGLLEEVGDGCPLGGDQVVARSALDATGQAGSPIVPSGQNAVSGGRADGA